MEKNSEKLALEYEVNGNGILGSELSSSPLHVERPVYQIEELNKEGLYEAPSITLRGRCFKIYKNFHALNFFYRTVPLLTWLPEYSWRRSFLSDVITGITVAIMHIPQGMAYGLLGGVPPVVGIYMGFFPVLVYFIFGTSRHVSIGTFAIVCLMTGKVVNQYSTVEIMQDGTARSISGDDVGEAPVYTNVQIAMTVTFTVACFQLGMYLLRLGVVSTLLSDTLVNGFTCASAFHVVSSQLKDLFGLPTEKRRGNFSLIFTVYDSIMALPRANINACVVSGVAFCVLIINNEWFKPWLSKRTKLPFPIELVAVTLGTTVSYLMNLNRDYHISVVGHIPTGLPKATLPVFELIPSIVLDAFLITMVSYVITMSMGLIIARKVIYEVDSNQELLALGLSNTVGSFFSCMPVTASLSRTMIQYTVGGVTQVASVVSCGILLVILLWIGPVFEALPRCVLASIIVVALKGMLLQCTSIVKYFKLSKWDALVWIVTFTTTLLVQISIGLAAGVAVSLISIFIQGSTPYTCLLGVVPHTDLYLDLKRYKGAVEISGIKIFHYSGGLSFASRTKFKSALCRKIGFDPAKILRNRRKLQESGQIVDEVDTLLTKCVVLDFSCLTFVDPSGVDFLRQLRSEFAQLDISMYIAGCLGPVFEVIKSCDRTEHVESKFYIFPTVHDAVLFSQNKAANSSDKID